jgi:hypothetical protein
MFHVKQMRRVIITASPRSNTEWDVRIQWYPSQTNHFATEHVHLHLRRIGRASTSGPWIAARLVSLQVANWIKRREDSNTFAKVHRH